MLGIKPAVWFNWKGLRKNLPLFNETISRIKAIKIDNLLTDIEDIGDGIGMKQPDWRAKQFVLQVTAPERFVLNNSTPATPEPANLNVITDALRRAFLGPITDINAEVVSEKNQTQIKALPAPARAIPPRKPKPTC